MEEHGGVRAAGAHCLVLTYPTQGHINPMLQFSKTLANKGVKITLVTTNFMLKTLHNLSGSIALDTISDGYDEGGIDQAESIDAYLTTFQHVGSETLEKLVEKLGNLGRSVDCIVYDAFLPWALGVAKRFGLLGAVFFTQSCAVDNIYYHVHKGLLRLPLVGLQVLVPGLPAMVPEDMPSFIYHLDSFPAIYKLVVNQFVDIDKVDWVICNTFYKLEQEVIDWMSKVLPMSAIGPAMPSMYLQDQQPLQQHRDHSLHLYEPNLGRCINWLNQRQDESVVYVSFGSLVDVDIVQMEELAWGLKQSDQYFMWVVRKSEEAKLPNKFVQEITSEKGLVVPWCSQLDVLAHKAIGCFVTHCGWNSTLEAISLGVPMVAMPQWSDQSTNSKFVADVWKTGVKAQLDTKGIVARHVVENCIREVMDGERGKEMKRNAKKWMELAREAVKEGGSSGRSINEFVAKLARH